MKYYLLPENGNFYKANMHNHTTVSDGAQTPERIKEYYMQHGYSVVAFTDHDVLIPHPELNDENFLALNGYEMEINEEGNGGEKYRSSKTCHICLVAKEPDNLTQVCWHRSDYLFSNSVNYKNQVRFDESLPDYVRVYSHDGINEMMRLGKEAGFFVTYNHPNWSREDYRDYSGYYEMDAMEIINYSSVVSGYEEHNERVYDDLAAQGKRVYCIAADDNHNDGGSCGGWIQIKADRLEYRAITSALEKGSFYSSEGPEIRDLYIEDGKVHIETSPCRSISYYAISRWGGRAFSAGGELTSASFDVRKGHTGFRIEVTDAGGYHAYTNYYFTEDLPLNE